MGQNFIKNQFRDCKLLNQFNNFCYQNDWSKLVAHCLKFISKLLKKYVAGSNSHKKVRNTDIIKSIQWKNRNQRDNQKWGTKKSVSRFGNCWIDSVIFAIRITR